MKVVTLGAHVLDVLVRPVTEIPEGQGSQLVEEIRIGPAGPAGGTAITLAKLGAEVHTAGAIGADALGDQLVSGLEGFGVDCSALARRADVQTSASVLPIRPNGDRPAFHVIGANAAYTEDDVPWEIVEAADFLHVGSPELVGPELAAKVLAHAREHGATTSADVLADGWPELLDYLAPALAHADWLRCNREQARLMTGREDLAEAAGALMDRGARGVAATCGADGSLVVTGDGATSVPAFEIDVVDTTGCGDAFSAGFARGLGLGQGPAEAALLGAACAALVAGGLGSDAGEFDLESALAFARDAPRRAAEPA
jgi:sugar/nucleoside kinase (ribokinase family)